MKKSIVLAIIMCIGLTQGCKKDSSSKDEVALTKKYARYSAAVYKDKELVTWLATLSKTEEVDLLGLEKVLIKNKPQEVAYVKLSTDSKGYIATDNLADKPLVFLEDTKVYVRNNIASTVVTTIPKGTIGFIVEEKGNWIQVFVGKINNKWITKQWVQGGFSTDIALIVEARTYEDAAAILDKGKGGVEAAKWDDAIEKMNELKSTSSIFSQLATDKMAAIEGSPASEEMKEKPADDGEPEPTGEKGTE